MLRCGCCAESFRLYCAEDGVEIDGVSGAIEDWREILLPSLVQVLTLRPPRSN